jgi:hypothetical protein
MSFLFFVLHIAAMWSIYFNGVYVRLFRASHRVESEYCPIVFLCPRLPDEEEFESLQSFPDIFYVVGDSRRKRDLIKGGIDGAEKVIIMNLTMGNTDDFSDSGAL